MCFSAFLIIFEFLSSWWCGWSLPDYFHMCLIVFLSSSDFCKLVSLYIACWFPCSLSDHPLCFCGFLALVFFLPPDCVFLPFLFSAPFVCLPAWILLHWKNKFVSKYHLSFTLASCVVYLGPLPWNPDRLGVWGIQDSGGKLRDCGGILPPLWIQPWFRGNFSPIWHLAT